LANAKETETAVKITDADWSAAKAASSLGDFESGKIRPRSGWLKEAWDKWPRDESIEELLAALKDT